MKSFIVIALCSSIILEGCYSYFSVVNENGAWILPPPDRAILITTTDGNEIEVEPFHYIEFLQPSSFVFGVGEKVNKHSTAYEEFQGIITPIRCDTDYVKISVGWSKVISVLQLIFLLQDSSLVRFKEGDYIVVDSAKGVGLWCIGLQRDFPDYLLFSGRIPFEKIKDIEVRRFSVWRSSLLGLGIVLSVALIFLLSLDFK
ncbi:MAG: hypothetical protein HY800_07675 [Ignavibacteriales bacterium]|nr:hypothetical protein [Ignavibacteriales bacterium]